MLISYRLGLDLTSVFLRTSGLIGVIEEIEMDVKRLAKRNFGRDDRYVCIILQGYIYGESLYSIA